MLNPETPFVLGSAQIIGPAIAPTSISHTGLLIDSDAGTGNGFEYIGVGDYKLTLSPECDVAPDDCYVLGCVATGTTMGVPVVDLSGLAGAAANPATAASVEVFFFDDAGVAVEVDGFTITLAKRPTG